MLKKFIFFLLFIFIGFKAEAQADCILNREAITEKCTKNCGLKSVKGARLFIENLRAFYEQPELKHSSFYNLSKIKELMTLFTKSEIINETYEEKVDDYYENIVIKSAVLSFDGVEIRGDIYPPGSRPELIEDGIIVKAIIFTQPKSAGSNKILEKIAPEIKIGSNITEVEKIMGWQALREDGVEWFSTEYNDGGENFVGFALDETCKVKKVIVYFYTG